MSCEQVHVVRSHSVTSLVSCTVASRNPNTSRICAMIFDCATAPIVLEHVVGGHIGLLGHMRNDRRWDLVPVLREASFRLEEFEQEGKAKPGRPSFVGKQRSSSGVRVQYSTSSSAVQTRFMTLPSYYRR